MRIALICILFPLFVQAQFEPGVGQIGSSAIYKDSSMITSWARECVVERGLQNILDTSLGYASVGDEFSATGPALENGVVSLGDGGVITCTFQNLIHNLPGPDFVVFENGFDNYFLELALVEVSSDGTHFFRFPATSNTNTNQQISSFDSLDATLINNLAGKYRAGYGTPFDLSDLIIDTLLDLQKITHVRIIDVVGIIDPNLGTYDQYNHLINDPFPTPFPSGGFDLDAIGVIHETVDVNEQYLDHSISIYPNPCPKNQSFFIESDVDIITYKIYDLYGHVLSPHKSISKPGIYFIYMTLENQKTCIKKLIIQ